MAGMNEWQLIYLQHFWRMQDMGKKPMPLNDFYKIIRKHMPQPPIVIPVFLKLKEKP